MKTMTSNRNGYFIGIVLLAWILIITVSNHLASNRIENRLSRVETLSAPEPIVPDHSALRKLRRMALLSAPINRQILLTASNSSDNKKFYSKVKLEAHCPIKLRIGGDGDGGKYVCNPEAVKDDCTLVSLGLCNSISYDQEIYNVTGKKCKMLGADVDAQNNKTQSDYSAMGGQLFTGRIPTEITIPDILHKAGRREVEILKIDIESGEFTSLEPLIKDHFVCQILIEVHGTPQMHLQMLQTMARYGFRIFNVDPNPLCPSCCEYSVINELCMPQFGVTPLGITIPQPK